MHSTALHALRRHLLTEPRRPPSIRDRPTAHRLVVATVCVGAFMGQLDASIVTLAFPTLQHHFRASVGSVEWVALAYLVVLVASLTAIGHLADMIGRKLLYTYGFVLFAAASVACGLAPALGWLIGFRALQALGAAMLQANSVALIATAVPRNRVGHALGVQGAAQALGLALGPTVGGVLIGTLGWRWIFFVNAPVGVVGTTAGWYLLPRSRDLAPRRRFDSPGLALFVPAVAAGLVGLSLGQRLGFGSPPILGALAGCGLFGVLFVRRERSATAPMLDLGLFRVRAFATGITAGLLSFLVMFGVLLVVPFLLENARHVSPATTGLTLTALPAALGIVAPFAGRHAQSERGRVVSTVGMAAAAAALAAAAITAPGTGLLAVLLAVTGAGLGAFMSPNNAAIMHAAPRRQSGQAAGTLNTTRGLGTALGVAVTATIYGAVAGHAHLVPAAHTTAGFRVSTAVLAVAAAAVAALTLRRDEPAD
jgi:EmrB/QacA subfamily drug resistance transporter